MVKPAIPRPSIFFRMAGSGRISEGFRRRSTRFPVRKRSTQEAETSWLRTEAAAAPRTPPWET